MQTLRAKHINHEMRGELNRMESEAINIDVIIGWSISGNYDSAIRDLILEDIEIERREQRRTKPRVI